MSLIYASRGSLVASTSRAPLLILARRGKKADAGRPKVSSAQAAARREAYYERMNVTDDTRVLDQRDLLYGMRLDPKRAQAYADARAKAVAEATPFPEEVRETVVNAWLLHQRRQREQDQELARARHASLVKALDDLERLDPVRFKRATDRPACQEVRDVDAGYPDEDGRLPGLFPRQLRVPGYTAGTAVFDDQWRRPSPAEEE